MGPAAPVIALGAALVFALLALLRGHTYGDRLWGRQGLLALGFVLAAAGLVVIAMRPGPVIAVGLAALAICAWTDAAARRVYLPVLAASAVAAVALRSFAGELGDGVAGGAVLGGLAMALFLILRGRGFAGGDVLVVALVGLTFGLREGLAVITASTVLATVLVGGLVLARVLPRAFPIPLALFVLIGALLGTLIPGMPG